MIQRHNNHSLVPLRKTKLHCVNQVEGNIRLMRAHYSLRNTSRAASVNLKPRVPALNLHIRRSIRGFSNQSLIVHVALKPARANRNIGAPATLLEASPNTLNALD